MENMCLAYENRCLGYSATKPKLPLLLVTGFLGAGKTTLLRHLLCNKSNLRMAVLVNELGSIDIDGALLKSTDNNAGLGICTQELTNGCVCCNVKDDLRKAVLSVLDRRDTVDYLVVETSGAADPRPVAATLAQLCRLDLVVTVVDGTAAAEQCALPLFRDQLAAADLVLLNKSDLLEEPGAQAAEAQIAASTSAKCIRTSHGKVPLDLLMDLQVQAASTGADTSDGFLSHDGTSNPLVYSVGGRPHFHNKATHAGFDLHAAHADALVENSAGDAHARSHGHAHAHEHAHGVGTAVQPSARGLRTVAFKSGAQPLGFSAFEQFVFKLTREGGEGGKGSWGRIWRAKGIVWFAEARKTKYEFHLSGASRVDITEEGPWTGEPVTQLVVIGEGLDAAAIEAALHGCEATPQLEAHEMRAAISTDPNFELWSPEADAGRAAGEDVQPIFFGLRETDEMRLHGVYARNLNRELVSAVNALRCPVLALPFTPPGSACAQVLVSAPAVRGGEGGGESGGGDKITAMERWGLLRETGYKILESKCISRCKCGF